MEIRLEIIYRPPAADGSNGNAARLCVQMMEPGQAEPVMEAFEGKEAERLFGELYAQVQSGRMAGRMRCGAANPACDGRGLRAEECEGSSPTGDRESPEVRRAGAPSKGTTTGR